jgi:hypothetical protein
LLDFNVILYGDDGIEYYLDYIPFNPAALTISKWLTFKHLSWVLVLNCLVDLNVILYECDGIEGDLDSILLNPATSNISKWRTFNLLGWVLLLNRLVDLDEILYGVREFNITSTTYYLIQ